MYQNWNIIFVIIIMHQNNSSNEISRRKQNANGGKFVKKQIQYRSKKEKKFGVI